VAGVGAKFRAPLSGVGGAHAGEAADDLAAAAAGLPAGNAALDPGAIVAERSASEAFHLAKGAASIIVRACGIYPLTETGDDPKGVALILAASIPPGIVQLYDCGPSRFGQNTDAEAATIQAMRDLTATYATDPSLALVRIARGEFPGVNIGMPVDSAELAERRENLRTFHLARRAA